MTHWHSAFLINIWQHVCLLPPRNITLAVSFLICSMQYCLESTISSYKGCLMIYLGQEHTLVYQLNQILSLSEQSTHQNLYSFSIEHWNVTNELSVFMPFQHFIYHRDVSLCKDCWLFMIEPNASFRCNWFNVCCCKFWVTTSVGEPSLDCWSEGCI